MGDPACDLAVAWNPLSAEARDVFRAALPVDDATWVRGRGWAPSVGLIAPPYYANTDPAQASIPRRAIDQVLADHQASGPMHSSAPLPPDRRRAVRALYATCRIADDRVD